MPPAEPTPPITNAEGKPVDKTLGLTTIEQTEKGGKRVRLMVNGEKTRAVIVITPLAPFLRVAPEDFDELFEKKGIVITDERREDLNALIEEINNPEFKVEELEGMDPFLVAQGIEPRHGKDGWIEWNVDVPAPGEVHLIQDEKGNVDLRSLGKVVNVREEDLLLTVHEPLKGEPGTDVFGKPIPARNGEKVKITKGKGVKVDAEGKAHFAEIEGCVRWNGVSITVEPVYVVPGDLDFSVGNIKFNGSVVVQKDVLDGFEVEARDGIEVLGMAGQTKLVALQGSVTVRGGIQGANKGLVKAGQNVFSRYLNNLKVDCDGDVVVEREVLNCEINCSGKVRVPKGHIIGGKIVALGGIEADVVGAEQGTRTALVLNHEYFQTSETREIDAKVEEIQKKLEQIENALGPIVSKPERLSTLPQAQRERILKLIETQEQLNAAIEKLQGRRDQIVRQYASKIGNEILVFKTLFPGTDVRIDTCRQVFNQAISGPVKLKPNYARGTIQMSSL
ncbi:MAG: DUF342 domain-containing protein [Planctomycetes bacterium]|nr:DUF342 domain-containing protein [Planctomycetota bacterium]